MFGRVPVRSAIFVGRDEQLRRVEHALARVPVALICGLAGVGKSALALAAAERCGRSVVYRSIGDHEPVDRVIDDLRRALARGPVSDLGSDDECLADLVDRLDAFEALVVLDDLHRLDTGSRCRLVRGIGQLLRRGRLLVTTRELPDLGTGFDRLELRLSGIDEDHARALWTALDELYGSRPGFDAAWRRAQGNPLLLRQAHAGVLETAPYAALLASITADERRVAGVLAFAHGSLSMATLAPLLPDGRVAGAIRGLSARMIVDVHPNGTCALHDLCREQLRPVLLAEERAGAQADLARLLRDAPLDTVTKVRELCRHLGALDRHEQAGEILVMYAPELMRLGAARELLGHLEAIPKVRRTTSLQVIRARTLGRLHDLESAHDALSQLLEPGTESRLEVLLGLGPIAMVTGRMAAAERAFTEILAHHALAPWPLVRTQFAFGLLRTYQGYGDDGRTFLRRATASAESHEAEGVLFAAEAYSFSLEDRDAEAAEPLRRASSLLQGCSPTLHGMFLAVAALAVVLGRLGRFSEAEPWLRLLAAARVQNTEPRSRSIYKAVVASLDYERGERARAMAALTEVVEEAEQGGDMLGSLWSRTYIARLLLLMGRRRQAMARLDEIEARARALGIQSAVRAVERSRLLDPLAQLRGPGLQAEPSAKVGAAVRARCIAALRAARDGDDIEVAAMLDANEALTAGPDYALDRALGHLARAGLARAQSESKVAMVALADARREAQAGSVDPDVIEELDAELGRLRVVTGARARLRASYSEVATSESVVLDGRSHELRMGKRVRSIGRQAMLREILYALSGRVGCVVSKQEVAMRLWGGQYDPTIHDNRLWANVRRLRLLLSDGPLNVEFADDGYRLASSEAFVFIEPLE